MNILILGNGFDLAHKLNTKYTDFLNYCKTHKQKDTNYSQNLWLQHFINKQNDLGDTWIDIEMDIYNVLINLVSNKDLFDYLKIGAARFELKKSDNNFKFENFMNYISNYSKSNISKEQYKILQEKGVHKGDLNVYIEGAEGLANFLYDQLRIFTKFFEDYLLEITQEPINNKYKLSLKSVGIHEGDKDVYVLNFNYTNTCEKFYTEKFKNYSNIERFIPIYVHGNVVNNNDYKTCKLVLGTHSFNSVENSNKKYKIPVCFNIFQKHNQRHKYGTIESYQELIRELKNERNKNSVINFHVIGHSLDKTDHNILKHILLAKDNSIINIYYHNQDTLERLINNITDIIGEEEVMSKVRFIHQHNDERSILKEINPT